jgi:flagellar hook-associated protein 3 FlgL
MRITDKMQQSQVMSNLNKNRTELSSLQNQASTMKRITKPSDDPMGTARVLQNRTGDQNMAQFDKNIFLGKSFLDTTESVLSQMSDVIVRAKELAIQAANDTNQGLPREMVASEVEQIYNSIVEMSNRRFGDRYVFSGHQTTVAPFTKDGTYMGDDGQIQIQTIDGQFTAMNLVGSQVFLGEDLSYGGKVSENSTVPKTVEELQKFKMDQVEAEFHKEEAEHDQFEIRGPANVGSVQRVGERAAVSKDHGINIFKTVMGLEAALRTNDKAGIQDSLDGLDLAMNQINLARAEVGGRINQLNASAESNQRNIVDNKAYNSQIEDADVFQVMTEMNRSNQTLQDTIATSQKFMSQSLLDFLR